MNRNLQPENNSRTNENRADVVAAAQTPTRWTRRKFLSNSTGLAIAGAIGGLATQLPASAHESAPGETNHPAARNDAKAPSARVTSNAAASPASTRAAASAKPRRIILDTDPGIDDMMAIFLALRSPELKVEAITPVCGNVPLEFTLPNALRLVEIAGRPDVPVAAGASHPLLRRLVTAGHVHGANGLAGVDFPEPKIKPVRETAPEIIRRIVRENPGEITIVAVGPLTNVALALRSDPELAAMIPQVAIMGGSLSGGNMTPAAEFNLYVDPEAARIVFDAEIPLTMVGLDVTRKCQLTEPQIQQLEAAQNPVSQTAGKVMRATYERMRKGGEVTAITMHDPLTIASLIDPDVITLKDYYVEVETEGEWTAGQTLGYDGHAPVRKSPPMDTSMPGPSAPEEPFKPNSKVAVGVNPEKFFHLLLPRLTG
ncbi:MAG: nucleoside hydrolase, partial [Candidatus Acidiferrales bacterium]